MMGDDKRKNELRIWKVSHHNGTHFSRASPALLSVVFINNDIDQIFSFHISGS